MRLHHGIATRIATACLAWVGAANASLCAEDCMLFSGRAYAVGDLPNAVVIGDLNGDAIPDLATANYSSNDVSILLGTGGGAFAKAKSVAVTGSPQQIAIGDLDGDAKQDVVVALSGSESLVLLFGDGMGGVASSKSLSMKPVPSWLVLRDLNGDAKLDIVVADPKKVTVRL